MNTELYITPSWRAAVSDGLRYAMEGVILLLVTAAPWAFGGVDPPVEYALFAGVAVLTVLWSARLIVEGHALWLTCPIALALSGLFALGAVQLIPLPYPVLAAMSPANAILQSELRPASPEQITPGETVSAPALTPLSIYPHATRLETLRILAVLLVFACVRTQVATTEAMRRLAWVCVVNGVLITVLGLAQFAADPTGRKVFFSYETRGQPFGPFICRNHYPYFINLCLGLAIGLLLTTTKSSESDRRARRTMRANALAEQQDEDAPGLSILSLLHSPVQLWLIFAIALLVIGELCSLSRGGVTSLVIAAVAVFGYHFAQNGMKGRLDFVVVPVLIVAGFLAWFGIGPIEARLSTLWKGEVSTDGRVNIWYNLLPVVWRFPFFGTGYGTTLYIEPIYRVRDYPGYNAIVAIDHAHNDYLELWVEGGLIGLALSLFLAGSVVALGLKAVRRHEKHTAGKLAFGAMIGLVAVIVHSFVDFGLAIPAIGLLAATVAAYTASMSRADPSLPPGENSRRAVAFDLGGWGGYAGAAILLTLGYILVAHGYREEQVFRLRNDAFRALHKWQPPDPQVAINSLAEAVRRSPDDAELRVELGQMYLDARLLSVQRLKQKAVTLAALRLIAQGRLGPVGAFGPLAVMAAVDSPAGASAIDRKAFDDTIRPALGQFRAARDLNPFIARPHARFAAYTGQMAKAEPMEKYLERALKLASFDPELLYYAGLVQLKAGRHDAAWKSWHDSLTRDPKHAAEIVRAASAHLGPDELAKKVLPDTPAVLLNAARQFKEEKRPKSESDRLLERARDLLKRNAANMPAKDHYTLAVIERDLNDAEAASAAYKRALELDRTRWEWRLEYAELLYELQQILAAYDQLIEIKRQKPDHAKANQLLKEVTDQKVRSGL